jgi:hypothetical protein
VSRRPASPHAAALSTESLAGAPEQGNQVHLLASLEGLARVAAASGEEERGVRLLGSAAARREALEAPLSPHVRRGNEGTLAAARRTLGEAAFAAAWAAGQALSLDEAVAFALEESHEAGRAARMSKERAINRWPCDPLWKDHKAILWLNRGDRI